MAWLKNKIILTNTEEIPVDKYRGDKSKSVNGKTVKVHHRYLTRKSKGAGKPLGKLKLMKFNPHLNRRVLYVETKYK